MTTTNSGVYELYNSTRYNTEDLLAFFNTWEATVQKDGAKLLPPRGGEVGARLDISDFNPANPRLVERYYNQDTKQSEQRVSRRYLKNGSYTMRSRFNIGLLVPEKLVDTPLEALVAEQQGDRVAPQGMIAQLWDRLFNLYEYDHGVQIRSWYDYQTREVLLQSAGAITIRIEKKAAKIDLSERRLRKSRLKAKATAYGAMWALRDAKRHLIGVGESLSALAADSTAAKVPLALNMDDLRQARALLQELEAEVTRAYGPLER